MCGEYCRIGGIRVYYPWSHERGLQLQRLLNQYVKEAQYRHPCSPGNRSESRRVVTDRALGAGGCDLPYRSVPGAFLCLALAS